MTAVLKPKTEQTSTSFNLSSGDTSTTSSNLSTTSKLSPTSSETENEPTSSVPSVVSNQNKSNSSTMSTQEDLILNTSFDFHAFTSQQPSDETGKTNKKAVTDHVLENGERVVVVDPNVSDGEEEDEEPSIQQSPLEKAISSLFATASSNQMSELSRKRATNSKTVSGILAAKRRKVDTPQKKASEPDFSALNEGGLLASTASTSSFLSALTSTSSSRRKPVSTRPSSSNSDLTTSKSSLSDSGIVSADEQQSTTPRMHSPSKQFRHEPSSIPAPVLQLLINAAGGDSTNLRDLLSGDPHLLKAINEIISANPSQQHTLKIVPGASVKPEVKAEAKIDNQLFGVQQSGSTETAAQQYPSAEQIAAALTLWPDLLSTASKLDEQTAAKILEVASCNHWSNEETQVHSEDERDNQQDLLRLGSEWLLRELFEGKAANKSQQSQATQASRKRRLDSNSPHLKSSESVISQLKSNNKGHKQLAELEELEQFAAHFKRQRIKHGFTQGDVGVALGRRFGSDFSQTTISRFEALNLSFKNMCKLRPLMEEWMNEAELALQRGFSVSDIVEADTLKNEPVKSGMDNSPSIPFNHELQFGSLTGKSLGHDVAASLSSGLPDLNSILPTLKKRRKRTNLDNQQKDKLDAYFIINPRPDHQQMSDIASELDLDPDVVRVWYCNRRQKLRKN